MWEGSKQALWGWGGVAQRRVVCLLCGKLCVGALVPKKEHCVLWGLCEHGESQGQIGRRRPVCGKLGVGEACVTWGFGAGETGT